MWFILVQPGSGSTSDAVQRVRDMFPVRLEGHITTCPPQDSGEFHIVDQIDSYSHWHCRNVGGTAGMNTSFVNTKKCICGGASFKGSEQFSAIAV